MREYDIFFLGDEDSGKSSVFNYYSNDINDDNLIGIRKTSKKKKIGKHSETQFNFYDISPQECNKKIVKDLYQDVDIFIIFFNSEKTFKSIDYYIDFISKYKKGIIFILRVINNDNHNNEINYEEKIQEKYQYAHYYECVTKNFDKIFEQFITDLMDKRNSSISLIPEKHKKSKEPKNSKKSCCWFLFIFYCFYW